MTSGIQSKGVDLDSIFALYESGTHPAATGILVNGVDIATRYQPLPGTAAPATGILTRGADLNTLFSTTGGSPTPPTTQPNGVTYAAVISLAPSETSGGTQVICTASTSGWSITANAEADGGAWTGTTPTTTPSGSALSGSFPSGANQVEFAVGANSGNTTGTVTNNASSETTLTSAGVSVIVENQGPRANTNANYAVTVNWYKSGVWIGTGTINLNAEISAVG